MTESLVKTSAADLARSIQDGWTAYLISEEERRGRYTEQKQPMKRTHLWASQWRACTRAMTLELTDGDKKAAWKPDQLANFRRGRDRERDILADLPRIGRNSPLPFNVIGQQERFEVKDRKGRVCVTGKKDCEIEFENVKIQCPTEVKSWSQNLTGSIGTFEDVFRSPWTRSGGFQLLTYLYAFNRPLGLMILDRHGIPAVLPVELEQHLDKVEDFLSRAETALDHVHAGSLPDYIQDAAECKRCAFMGSVCNPPLDYGKGAQVFDDPELATDLKTCDETEHAWEEYEHAWKRITGKLRGVEMGLCDGHLIEGHWGKNTKLVMPEAIKKQYQVTDPKGKFLLTVTKLTEGNGGEQDLVPALQKSLSQVHEPQG